MTTVAGVDLSTWNRYPTSPRLRGSDPFGSNLISVGQAVESNLAQAIAGGDVVAAYTPSTDSRLIYVSATGNDGTGASTTIAAQTDAFDPQGTVLPYLTLAAAFAQARDGFPDWVLLKRDDTWTGENVVVKSGRGITEPYLMGYYGTSGARPLIKRGVSAGVNIGSGVKSNFVMYGIDYYCNGRDPSDPSYTGYVDSNAGFRFVGGGANITFDECVFRWFYSGMTIQAFEGNSHSNVTIKRCIITDNYGSQADGHSQGVYFSGIDGLTIEENFFDYNGWHGDISGADRVQYNHNLYIQTDNIGANLIFRNNISTRGSSHGVHGRPGGLYEENLFVGNAVSLQIGYSTTPILSGTEARAENNVILSGELMDPDNLWTGDTTAIWGLNVEGNILSSGGTAAVVNNIAANRKDTGVNIGIKIIAGVTYTNNAVYDWEASEDMTDVSWTHPEAELPAYMTSIGETATDAAFYAMQRARPFGDYSGKYTSLQANNYFREGFNR